jgi:hypothetical protein
MTSDFEKEIQEKGLLAPRATPEYVESLIKEEAYYVFPGTTITVCCLTMLNGYGVTADSACAHPANFDEELGRKIARKKAIDKVYQFAGFMVKQAQFIKRSGE